MKSDTFPSITVHAEHQTDYGQFDYYITVCFFDDPGVRCRPLWLSVTVAKTGSETRQMSQGWAVAINALLTAGVDWSDIRNDYIGFPTGHFLGSLVKRVDEIIWHRFAMIEEDAPNFPIPETKS